MFTGLSAFPLTPITDAGVDEASFMRLIERLAGSGVDSICALGSTGSYAYLDRAERVRVIELAVRNAGSVPVIAGIGALGTRDILRNLHDAQSSGVSAVLLAPMTYQALTDDEVYGLYEEVAASASVPIIVYDNPATTHVTFSDELHGRIAQLDGIASIKIPGVPADPGDALARVAALRAVIPERVTIGVSGDGTAANGLLAGCEVWYSVIAGILPEPCLEITRAAAAGNAEEARKASAKLDPLWALFERYGSYRVASAVAEELRLVPRPNLPRPVRSLDEDGRRAVANALNLIGVYE